MLLYMYMYIPVLSPGVVKTTLGLCVVEECVEATLKAVEGSL